MAIEMYYTSATRGLAPGSSGFCTVAATRGFPTSLISKLEPLSGYRSPEGMCESPVAFSHWIVEFAGVERHILAAVRGASPDHTQRSNKHAHYVVLKPDELVSEGAAWMMLQSGTMSDGWQGEATHIEKERVVPITGNRTSASCETWEQVSGDAGWAGVLVGFFLLDATRPVNVIYPMGTPVLALVDEALSLLPAEARWRVTFSSYFMQPVAGLRCSWRFCLEGSEAAKAAQRSAQVIDLCAKHPLHRTNASINAARAGHVFVPAKQDEGRADGSSSFLFGGGNETRQSDSGSYEVEPVVEGNGERTAHAASRDTTRGVNTSRECRSETPTSIGRMARKSQAVLLAGLVVVTIGLVLTAVLWLMAQSEIALLKSRLATAEIAAQVKQESPSVVSEVAAAVPLPVTADTRDQRRDIEELKGKLSAALTQSDTLQGEIDTLRGQVADLESESKELQEQVMAATKARVAAERSVAAAAAAPLSNAPRVWASIEVPALSTKNFKFEPLPEQLIMEGSSAAILIPDTAKVELVVDGPKLKVFGETLGEWETESDSVVWKWSVEKLTQVCQEKLKELSLKDGEGIRDLASLIGFKVTDKSGQASWVRFGSPKIVSLSADVQVTKTIAAALKSVTVKMGEGEPRVLKPGDSHELVIESDGSEMGLVRLRFQSTGKAIEAEFMSASAARTSVLQTEQADQQATVDGLSSDVAILKVAGRIKLELPQISAVAPSGQSGHARQVLKNLDEQMTNPVKAILTRRLPSLVKAWGGKADEQLDAGTQALTALESELKKETSALQQVNAKLAAGRQNRSELTIQALGALSRFRGTVFTDQGVPLLEIHGEGPAE